MFFDNNITARTPNQKQYMNSLYHNTITIGAGSAGSGKTLLALFSALKALKEKRIKRIYYIRNEVNVDIGSKSRGALPGTLQEKSAHLLLPLMDNLNQIMPEQISRRYIGNEIQFLYVEDLRGRSLTDCFIICDETQNLPPHGVLTLLTRLGENSKVALIGDPAQKDINKKYTCGLTDAINRLWDLEGVGVIKFNYEDIQRNEITAEIIKRYAK